MQGHGAYDLISVNSATKEIKYHRGAREGCIQYGNMYKLFLNSVCMCAVYNKLCEMFTICQ